MLCKFCPGCGIVTVAGKANGGRDAAPVNKCGGCGADLGLYGMMELDELKGRLGTADRTEDNVLIRSRVTNVGVREGGDGSEGGVGGISDSVIQRSVVTTIGAINIHRDASCPQCGNPLSDDNRLGRCPECSVELCGTCAGNVRSEVQERYRGYLLHHGEGICGQCYRVALARQKADVDERVSAAFSAERETELLRSYTDEERSLLHEVSRTFSEDDTAGALAMYDRVLKLNESNVLAQEGRWKALLELGYHREAVEFLDGIVAERPKLEKALLALSEALYLCGDADRAKAVLMDHLRRDVGKAGAWLRLGEIYLREGEGGKAASALKKAVETDGDGIYVESHLYLSAIAMGRGRYAEAGERLLKAREIDRDNPEARRLAGELSGLQAACWDEVRRGMRELEETRDEPSSGLFLRIGTGLISLGKRKEAAGYLRDYLELRPDDERTREMLREVDGG